MHSRPRTAIARLLQISAALAVSWALALPGVASAQKKVAKKQQASSATKPARAAKVVKPRAARTAKATKTKVPQRGKAGAASVARRAVARSASAPLRAAAYAPARLSFGQLAGLHDVPDPLDLKSSVALVVDQDTHEVLLRKNDQAVLPIASLTKLMTALIISQAKLPLDEVLTITQDDVDTEKGSSSRLRVGAKLTRGEMLHLALMSSENRAAHALGRTYPGGMGVFVQQMNIKAKLLGMIDTRYVEPTGLSSRNQSSARDLAVLVNVAHGDPLVREYSTSTGYEVAQGQRTLQYTNTNRLVHSPSWDIGLQKTGYISEAGRCLVMQAEVAGRKLIMVFLDSAGKFSRLADAERVRNWVENQGPAAVVASHQPVHAQALTAVP